MKKILTTFLSLLFCHTLYALPMGNPAEPTLYPAGFLWGRVDGPCSWMDDWHLRAGYCGDFVFNRNLSIEKQKLPQGHVVRKTTISTDAGYLALNFNNMIDLFSTFGASRIRLQANQEVWGANATFDSLLSTNTHFSWSIGGRAALLCWRCFTLGVEGNYFRTAPQFKEFLDFNGGNTAFFNSDNQITYSEWQFGGGLSYTIQTWQPCFGLTPYIGLKVAHVHLDTNGFHFISPAGAPLTIFNLHANKRWGYAIGATLSFCDCIGFTAEGRWGDEKALSINGQICF